MKPSGGNSTPPRMGSSLPKRTVIDPCADYIQLRTRYACTTRWHASSAGLTIDFLRQLASSPVANRDAGLSVLFRAIPQWIDHRHLYLPVYRIRFRHRRLIRFCRQSLNSCPFQRHHPLVVRLRYQHLHLYLEWSRYQHVDLYRLTSMCWCRDHRE